MLCMTWRHHTHIPGPHRKILLTSAAVLALTAAAIGAAWLGRFWNGDPYPIADPAVTSQRLDGVTEEVYEALGLPQAELDPDWPGNGLEADGEGCYYTGLKDLFKELSDSPPSVPGVVSVSSEWVLKGVASDQAKAALRRARKELERRGWKVTSYETSHHVIRLGIEPPETGDAVWVEAYPRDRLEIAAHSECSRYPSGTPVNDLDEPDLPAQQAPTRLRN